MCPRSRRLRPFSKANAIATLIVDTCLSACTVTLANGDAVIASTSLELGIGHAEHVAPLTQQLLADSELGIDAVSAVSATVGPGSFMGVRVGISFAKGIAVARGLPTYPISTFDALRWSAGGDPRTAVAIDARRGQVYLEDRNGDALLSMADAQERLRQTLHIVGSGAPLVRGTDSNKNAMILVPTADGLAAAVARASPGPLQPLYLRAPDAKRQSASLAQKAAPS